MWMNHLFIASFVLPRYLLYTSFRIKTNIHYQIYRRAETYIHTQIERKKVRKNCSTRKNDFDLVKSGSRHCDIVAHMPVNSLCLSFRL